MSRPGSIGKPTPGFDCAVIRPDGTRAEPDELGQIAVRRPNPVMFLEYWRAPEATVGKFLDDWMLTGDEARVDLDCAPLAVLPQPQAGEADRGEREQREADGGEPGQPRPAGPPGERGRLGLA